MPTAVDFMNRAIELAAKAGCVLPNPKVGAVIVHLGKIVGEGFHRGPGKAHAEIAAIQNAKRRGFKNFKKSTLYITLEPCCHLKKRTPPCVPAILKAGFKNVVIAHEDPNLKVSGNGIRQLRKAGLTVKVGLLANESAELNQAFIKNQLLHQPYISLKVAMTFDGKMADDFGNSKWITSELARDQVHRIRAQVDAIGVGSKTVDRDRPFLNVRIGSKNIARKIVIFGKPKPASLRNIIRANGEKNLHILRSTNLKKSITDLYRKDGVNHLLIEGGPKLASSFLKDGLVDELLIYLGSGILGGSGRYSLGSAWRLKSLAGSIRFQPSNATLVGPDVRIQGFFNVYGPHSKLRRSGSPRNPI